EPRAVAAPRGDPALPQLAARRGLRRRVADADVRPPAARRGKLHPGAGRLRRGPHRGWDAVTLRLRATGERFDPRPARSVPRTARQRVDRGPVALRAALPRNDRP